jgi:uncharacterized protein (DUF983 family)
VTGPFDDLDPDEPAAPRQPPGPTDTPRVDAAPRTHIGTPPAGGRREPGALVAFVRGATKRCPRCGSGGLFTGWFTILDRCPRCGLRLEREEGGFLGAMVLSYVVTAVLWLGLLIGWLIVDLPDLHVGALTIASIAIAGLVPLLFWPFSKTIWASVDYLVYRTSPDYASREAADHSSGNGGRP